MDEDSGGDRRPNVASMILIGLGGDNNLQSTDGMSGTLSSPSKGPSSGEGKSLGKSPMEDTDSIEQNLNLFGWTISPQC